jgi:hypothetical protein
VRTFYLERSEDESGVSGIGRVAEGVLFTNGKCALSWLTGPKETGRSICIYDSWSDIKAIHGHGGKTKIVWERR